MIIEAIDLSVALTEEAIRLGKFSISETKKKETHVESSGENKRKFTNFKKGTRANHNNKTDKGRRYGKCDNCGKVGHDKETCWRGTGRGNGGQDGSGNRGGNNYNNNYQGGNGDDQGRGQGCFNCGDVGHLRKYFSKNNQVRGRVSNIGAREARQDPNVVTELANGKLVEAKGVIRDYVIELGEREFSIDLLPVEFGSFDVVVGMDWLSSNRAEIVCHEKVFHILMAKEEMIVIHEEKEDTPLRIISCLKARKFLRKGCVAFLTHVVDKEAEEPKFEDIPVVRKYAEVFPEDFQDYLLNNKSDPTLTWFQAPHLKPRHPTNLRLQRCRSYQRSFRSC
ncbi:uncharacterized protein LOC110866540 [Helianthus annuus]|uniref:uncharacterized protein LOC110866540 n=1 Tax=Helianthus annuus TaxID=4232 RepID=UPI000B9019B2|nr:uncharacterized protein LOC110866540 [Helianthus annuus]